MIRIEIINSPDAELLGEHLYYYDFISIGSTENDRILLTPPYNKGKKFRLCLNIFSEEKISTFCLPQDEFYLSKNKKVSGKKLHNKDETIEYSGIKIKIIDFKFTENIKATKHLDSDYNDLILELEKEYIRLEKTNNASI